MGNSQPRERMKKKKKQISAVGGVWSVCKAVRLESVEQTAHTADW